MARSTWKVPFISNLVLSKDLSDVYKVFNMWNRNSTIPKIYIDRKLRVYNGRHFISFVVKPAMVGQKIGEFSITKVLGSAVGLSMELKAKRKKRSKKSK